VTKGGRTVWITTKKRTPQTNNPPTEQNLHKIVTTMHLTTHLTIPKKISSEQKLPSREKARQFLIALLFTIILIILSKDKI
jgi:hypothetical protein